MSSLALFSCLPLLFTAVEDLHKSPTSDWKQIDWAQMEAGQILEKLPERALTVEFVLGVAVESSDAFDEFRAEGRRIPVPHLRARAGIQPELYAGGVYEDDRSEPGLPFGPTERTTWGAVAGVRTRLPTGTSVQLQSRHERSSVVLPSTSADTYHLNRLELLLSQSLLKDAFGSGTRNLLRSGTAGSKALAFALKAEAEGLLVQFVDLFLNSWLAQTRVQSARENVGRRQRLKRSVDIRFKRGNAFKSEVLQVESALMAAEVEQMNAERDLSNTWRALVIGLGLPERFLEIDPVEIPVKLDQSLERAIPLCNTFSESLVLERNHSVLASQFNAEALREKLNYTKSENRVDLQAKAAWAAQNRENHFEDAVADSLGQEHNSWSLGLELNIPLIPYRQRADEQEARAESLKADARASLARARIRVQWANACQGLKVASAELLKLRETVDKQARRESFERERYQIGNVSALNVVLAGDDLAFAEQNLRAVEASSRAMAWQVMSLSGELIKKFESQLGGQF